MEQTSGPELRHERELANLTQAQVAAQIGCDRTVIVRKEAQVRVHAGWAQRYRDAIREIASQKATDAA